MLRTPVPHVIAEFTGPGWIGSTALLVALLIIGALVWLLWRAQRTYALELEEQARHVTDAQEKASRARQDKEALARESQGKSEMLATLSRETRAHLNGIIGSADLLLDTAPKPEQREHLATLRSSAEALHQSLNDVLEYSRIETGHIQIGHAAFDLRQPLIEVVDQLLPLALLKGLELVLIVAPDVPLLVAGDPGRLKQILLNLASNAVKFTSRGRVVLRVELAPGSASVSKLGATWVHFSVSDTGESIPEDMTATIFERFVQSDSPSPRKFGGSGLELAICKRLVELMGGSIGARGLPEAGAEFWVVLPLAADRLQAPVTPVQLADMHVVVLNDLQASRIAASALLARLGVDHDATDTLPKATELLRDALEAEARELVLLIDEGYLNASADDLARLLAPNGALRSTRIVALSRTPEQLDAPPGVPLAATLRKPLLRSEVLLTALQNAAGAAAAEAKPAKLAAPHVLIVDDDEISRSVSSQLLERMGCIVERTVSGAEAIERTRVTRFDLIFMDCQMPEMDGFTATKRIRAAAGTKAPPIVALTANTSMADREKCFSVGMCDFVDKPVRKAELVRVLKRWTHAEPVGAK
jgi:two-component system sensor histidine kinase/response regulator